MPDRSTVPQPAAVATENDLTIIAEYRELLRENRLDTLDGLFGTSVGERLCKPDLAPWRERFRLSLSCAGRPRTVYLKRFSNPPRNQRRETQRAGPGVQSVAGLEWQWMRRLEADGIPCVRPMAFGEKLEGGREIRSAILTEGVAGSSLESWVTRWQERDRATIRALIPPLARLVARLHRRGYVHRDLYLSHIFHDPQSPTAESLTLIDLTRVLRPNLMPGRWIIKDLASLNFSAPSRLVSNTDRLRWLTRYLGGGKLNGEGRRYVYRILGKTRRIAEHERRRAMRRQRSGGR